MKFLVDANLPFKLAQLIKASGFDAIHTDDLPNKERSTDKEIITVALEQNRILITKDSDFLDAYLVNRIPPKLLLVTTGNIHNRDLLLLFENNFYQIAHSFSEYNLIELDDDRLIIHEM